MTVALSNVKRILIGEPFPTSHEIHERLDKKRALAVFASDPISSNAYATEAIMSILVVLGSGALAMTLPIALAIAVLVLFVVFSYVQTILHYPGGGGAYIVAKDNLGTFPSLIAAAALLIDYILTVSVSVSAGIRAISSAYPAAHDYRVWLALGAIALLTWLNLRGARESGTIFAVPTYAFVGGVLLMIATGLVRYFGLFGAAPMQSPAEFIPPSNALTGFAFTWLILRAFAAGCTALTGIEAISDGVQAFKPPEAKNAATTMIVMGVIAMTLFSGITFLATRLHLAPSETESILSQLSRTTTGGGLLYYWVQLFTMLILVLAANTGFQDFPRLSYFLARDGFLPRWMTQRGDRLVYSSGILALALLASLIVIIFQANEIAMLPLYALGVMVSFTVSQSGMVRLMNKVAKLAPGKELTTGATVLHHESGVFWKRAVSAIGAVTTLIVLAVLVITKFREGAWVIVASMPLLIVFFQTIKRHYGDVASELTTQDFRMEHLAKIADVVIVPIADVHRGILRALQYARLISNNVRAVSITTTPAIKERIRRRWQRFPELTQGVELVCIDYDYRNILEPLVDYIVDVNQNEFANKLTTVVIPAFVSPSAGARFLHNQTANLLRNRLRQYKDIVIIDVPYHIGSNRSALANEPPPRPAEPVQEAATKSQP